MLPIDRTTPGQCDSYRPQYREPGTPPFPSGLLVCTTRLCAFPYGLPGNSQFASSPAGGSSLSFGARATRYSRRLCSLSFPRLYRVELAALADPCCYFTVAGSADGGGRHDLTHLLAPLLAQSGQRSLVTPPVQPRLPSRTSPLDSLLSMYDLPFSETVDSCRCLFTCS